MISKDKEGMTVVIERTGEAQRKVEEVQIEEGEVLTEIEAQSEEEVQIEDIDEVEVVLHLIEDPEMLQVMTIEEIPEAKDPKSGMMLLEILTMEKIRSRDHQDGTIIRIT